MKLPIVTPDPLGILESSRAVMLAANHVRITERLSESMLAPLARELRGDAPDAHQSFGDFGAPEDRLQLIFIENVVNFCFWAEKGKPNWHVERPDGRPASGGWYNLVACFERAFTKGYPLVDARYLATMPLEDVRDIFRGAGDVDIPLVDARHRHLQEAGSVLFEKYDGRIERVIAASGHDAIALVREVVAAFSSFRDIAAYRGKEVPFLKRAQILASDLAVAGVPLARVSELTAFADYKLPQMLREFGIIEYDGELARTVDSESLISKDSEEEVEIRAATIWGVELIRQALRDFSAARIDYGLWRLSQDQGKIRSPHHRTYSPYY